MARGFVHARSGVLVVAGALAVPIGAASTAADAEAPRASPPAVVAREVQTIPLDEFALDAADGALHVVDVGQGQVQAVDASGAVEAVYDLSDTDVRDPQTMLLAPSTDNSDDPELLNLFVVDAGDATTRASVAELTLQPAPQLAVPTTNARLLQRVATSEWAKPSPDPSGIAYRASDDRLIVVDSEADETTGAGQTDTNLWYVRRDGGVVTSSGDTYAYSDEPTGASHSGGSLYVSDDDANELIEVRRGPDGVFGTPDDVVANVLDVGALGITDAEDPVHDPDTGDVWLLDGINTNVHRIDLDRGRIVQTIDVGPFGITDAEAMAYDADRGTLVVGNRTSELLYEMTTGGRLVQVIDVGTSGLQFLSGMTIAPRSDGRGGANDASYYIVDRGQENSANPEENDGELYEFARPSLLASPVVEVDAPANHTNVVLGAATTFRGSAFDLEDGDMTSRLRWTSSIDGALGTGGRVTATLTLGTHRVTASVTDSDGRTGSETITVYVATADGPRRIHATITASSDDAEEKVSGGAVQLASNDLDLVRDTLDGTDQLVGLRFTGLGIPRDVVIDEAWVQFTADEIDTGDAALVVRGDDRDDAPTFTTTPRDISSRTRTDARVPWSPPAWDTIGQRTQKQRTPDIRAVVQEIVDRPGWRTGNDLALIITGSGTRTAEGFDQGIGEAAATLFVQYSPRQDGPTGPIVLDPGALRISGDAMAVGDESRIGTAVAISQTFFPGPVAEVLVATAGNFPDALASAPLADALRAPTLLVPPDHVPDVVLAELERLSPARVTLLGGTQVISSQVEQTVRGVAPAVRRLGGVDRFATAAVIGDAVAEVGDVSTVYVATGLGFADALAGGALTDGPILLVTGDAVPAATRSALEGWRPDRVVAFGGEVAIQQSVLDEIGDVTGAVVDRIWGPTRYGTAAAIAGWFPAPAEMVLVATGENYPDALAASGVAAALNVPMLLVQRDAVPAEVATELTRLAPAAIGVLGGPVAISDGVAAELEGFLP